MSLVRGNARRPAASALSAAERSGLWGLSLFALVWTALVLMFDGLAAVGLVRQVTSADFPAVPGSVLTSAVRRSRHRGHESIAAEVRYRYTVGGRAYESTTVRHGTSSYDAASAGDVVCRYPTGAAVAVRYDPADPAEAMLEPGLAGGDLYLLIFLVPFNAAAIGLWVGVPALRRRRRGLTYEEWAIAEEGPVLRVRRRRLGPWVSALVAAGASAFAAVFVLGFGFGPQPSIRACQGAAAIIAGLTVAVWLVARNRSGGTEGELVIDRARRRVELPAARGGPAVPTRVRFDEVEAVTVAQARGRGGLADGGRQVFYHVSIRWRPAGRPPRAAPVAKLYAGLWADAFAEWLRETLRPGTRTGPAAGQRLVPAAGRVAAAPPPPPARPAPPQGLLRDPGPAAAPTAWRPPPPASAARRQGPAGT